MKKLWLCGVCGLLFFLAACGQGGAVCGGTLAIHADEEVVLAETDITFTAGDSVLDILKKATRDAQIPMEYAGAGVTAYVQGINNLYEFDKGPESGWQYTVNGELIQQSAGMYEPAEGDDIVWQYVLAP